MAKPHLTTAEDFADPAVFQAAFSEYLTNRTGPLTVVNASSALPENAAIAKGHRQIPHPPHPPPAALLLPQHAHLLFLPLATPSDKPKLPLPPHRQAYRPPRRIAPPEDRLHSAVVAFVGKGGQGFPTGVPKGGEAVNSAVAERAGGEL